MKVMLQYSLEFALIHGTVECVTTMMVFVVAITCTIVVSLIVDHADEQEWILVESFSPKLFTFIITFTIAKLFAFLYDIACDTVLHCFAYNAEFAPDGFESTLNARRAQKYQNLDDSRA